MNIDQIRKLTLERAKSISTESIMIKEHDCILVDLGGRFGYSILVFKNGKHIYYANDYQLHHSSNMDKKSLRKFYVDSMNRKLFTDEELMGEIKTYDEYKRKQYFLMNYWIMQYDYISIFGIGKEAQERIEEAKKELPFLNPISFCYVSDRNIINIQKKYDSHLKDSYEKLKDSKETFREMVRVELANHEACITCSYDEALDSLGLSFDDLSEEKKKIVREELARQIRLY